MAGVLGEHPLKISRRPLGIARLLVDAGAEHEWHSLVGRNADRLVEIGDRLRNRDRA
jgi:hypothetical protein